MNNEIHHTILEQSTTIDIEQLFSKLNISERDTFFSDDKIVIKSCISEPFCTSSYFLEYFNQNPRIIVPHLSSHTLLNIYKIYYKFPIRPISTFVKNFFDALSYHYRDDVCISIALNCTTHIKDRNAILCSCIKYGMYRTVKQIIHTISDIEFSYYFIDFIKATTSIYEKKYSIYDESRINKKQLKFRCSRVKNNAGAILLLLLKKCSIPSIQLYLYHRKFCLWHYISRCINTRRCIKYLITITPNTIVKNTEYIPNLHDLLLTSKLRNNVLFRAYEYSSLDVIVYLENIQRNILKTSAFHNDIKYCVLGAFNNPNFKLFTSVFSYHKQLLPKLYEFCINKPSYIEFDIINTRNTPTKFIIKKLRFLHSLSPFPAEFINKLLLYTQNAVLIQFIFELNPTLKWPSVFIINALTYSHFFEKDFLYFTSFAKDRNIMWHILLFELEYHHWNTQRIQFIYIHITNNTSSFMFSDTLLKKIEKYLSYIPFYFQTLQPSLIRIHYIELYSNFSKYPQLKGVLDKKNENNFLHEALSFIGKRFYFPSFQIRKCIRNWIIKKNKESKRQYHFNFIRVINEYNSLPPGILKYLPYGGIDFVRARNHFNTVTEKYFSE